MEGWICLYRKIQEHWLWTKKRKFSQFEAWISLLFKTNYKDVKLMFNGKVIEVKKGTFITSEVKLAEEWGWSRDTVRKFLKMLQEENMIYRIPTANYTTIRIENWESYQFSQQQDIQQDIQGLDSTFFENVPVEPTANYTSLSIEDSEIEQIKQQKNVQQNIQVLDSTLDTNNNNNNIYVYLFNKYKAKIQGANFIQKIRAISECKKEKQYIQLSLKLQEKLFYELQNIKIEKRGK